MTTPRTPATTPPFVEIANGHQLFVRDWGAGPPVVLLAGWAMDSRIWGETMVALNQAGLRTIACDRRGHGCSTDPGLIDYDLLADDLAAVLEALDLRDVVLVTHSGAAGEAIRYLTRHGADRVSRLIMVGAAGPCMIAADDNPYGLPAEAVDALLGQLARDLPAWIDANAWPFAPTAHARTIDWLAEMVLDTPRRMIIDFQRAIAQADLREEAAAIRIPVTLVHGTLDASAPIAITAERYAALIGDAELLVYEDAAHGVMITHAARLANDIAPRARPA